MAAVIPGVAIRELLRRTDVSTLEAAIEEGFVAFSEGRATIPFPAHLDLPEGDCHIKYGKIDGDPFFVIKVATGFYGNQKRGLPSGDGYLTIHSQETGQLQTILLDEGHLTDVRTAIAGRVAAKYLAPRKEGIIGVVGTGVQARLQLLYLEERFKRWPVKVWGRSPQSTERYVEEMTSYGFQVQAAEIRELAEKSTLIITTTPSKEPVIFGADLRPGVHITAVGADGSGKQELDTSVFARADRIIVDSISQCSRLGDASFAIKNKTISEGDLVELGAVIGNPSTLARQDEDEVTVADLTGLAVQDIQIATAVYEAWRKAQ